MLECESIEEQQGTEPRRCEEVSTTIFLLWQKAPNNSGPVNK